MGLDNLPTLAVSNTDLCLQVYAASPNQPVVFGGLDEQERPDDARALPCLPEGPAIKYERTSEADARTGWC